MPLSLGQNLQVSSYTKDEILWECFNENKICWLEIRFSEDLVILQTSDREKALIAQKLLSLIKEKAPQLLLKGIHFKFTLEFNRQFGFGSSATLISLLGQWSGVDPYYLSEQTFGSSGYDIAAATAPGPFVYSRKNKIEEYCTLPEFITQHLLFIYLGEKQSSSREANKFISRPTTDQQTDEMNELVTAAAHCKQISAWEELMEESEQLVSYILKTKPVKEQLFADYPFSIKSLGAWGGDFMMASCRDISEGMKYFHQKQKAPIFTYKELTI